MTERLHLGREQPARPTAAVVLPGVPESHGFRTWLGGYEEAAQTTTNDPPLVKAVDEPDKPGVVLQGGQGAAGEDETVGEPGSEDADHERLQLPGRNERLPALHQDPPPPHLRDVDMPG